MLALCAVVSVPTTRAQDSEEIPVPTGSSVQVSPVTWAVKVADNSRCGEDGVLLETLTAQIPIAQRASEETAELIATVTVSREERSGRIVVFDRILQSEAGARELPLTSRRCAKIASALSLVMAVLVEAGRGAPPPPPPPSPPPEPEAKAEPKKAEPPPKPAPPPPPPTRPRPAARPVWRGPPAGHDLSLAVGTGYGLLPSFAPAMTIGWGIRPAGTWPIWIHATGWLESVSDDRHGRFRALYGGLMTCPLRGERGLLRGRACPSFAVGGLWAQGSGFEEEIKTRRPLVLVGLELGGSVTLTGPLDFTLLARVEGVPLRSRFVYRTRSGAEPQIHTPSPVVASLFGGLALRFR